MTRRDLIVYVSARNCNPNGDMDRDNRPRQDDLTGLGQISAVSSKRRIKSAVQQMFDVPMLIDPSLISIESKAKEVLANIDPAKLDEMTPLEKDKAIKKAICEKSPPGSANRPTAGSPTSGAMPVRATAPP